MPATPPPPATAPPTNTKSTPTTTTATPAISTHRVTFFGAGFLSPNDGKHYPPHFNNLPCTCVICKVTVRKVTFRQELPDGTMETTTNFYVPGGVHIMTLSEKGGVGGEKSIRNGFRKGKWDGSDL